MSGSVTARRRWTEEEDRILRVEVEASSEPFSDWSRTAAKLPGRTNKDCRKRWHKMGKSLRKGHWCRDEDERLMEAVQRVGKKWTIVSQTVGSRSADQCAKRWQHGLDPNLEKREWTSEEDRRLLAAVAAHGNSWKKIRVEEFSGRSATDIKNRHSKLVRGQGSGNSSSVARDLAEERSSSPASSSVSSDGDTDADVPMADMQDLMNDFTAASEDPDFGSLREALDEGEVQGPDSDWSSTFGASAGVLDDDLHGSLDVSPMGTFQLADDDGWMNGVCWALDADWNTLVMAQNADPEFDRMLDTAVAYDDSMIAGPTSPGKGRGMTVILEEMQADSIGRVIKALSDCDEKVKMRVLS